MEGAEERQLDGVGNRHIVLDSVEGTEDEVEDTHLIISTGKARAGSLERCVQEFRGISQDDYSELFVAGDLGSLFLSILTPCGARSDS